MNTTVIKDVLIRHGNNELKIDQAIQILENLVKKEIADSDFEKAKNFELQLTTKEKELKETYEILGKYKELIRIFVETIELLKI